MTEHEALTILLPVVGAFVAILMAIIAFFLNRMITQVDNLTSAVANVNATMLKIHGDLSGDVGVLQSEHAELSARVKDLDPLWDRMRTVETDMVKIQTRFDHLGHGGI